MPQTTPTMDVLRIRTISDPHHLTQILEIQTLFLKAYTACLINIKTQVSMQQPIALIHRLLIQTHYCIQEAKPDHAPLSTLQYLIENNVETRGLVFQLMISSLQKNQHMDHLIQSLLRFEAVVQSTQTTLDHPNFLVNTLKNQLSIALNALNDAFKPSSLPMHHHFSCGHFFSNHPSVLNGEILFFYTFTKLNVRLSQQHCTQALVVPAAFFSAFAHLTGLLFLTFDLTLTYHLGSYTWAIFELFKMGVHHLVSAAPLTDITKEKFIHFLQSNTLCFLVFISLAVKQLCFDHAPPIFFLATHLPYFLLLLNPYLSTKNNALPTNPYTGLFKSLALSGFTFLYVNMLSNLNAYIDEQFFLPDPDQLLTNNQTCNKFPKACEQAALRKLGFFDAVPCKKEIIKRTRHLQANLHPDRSADPNAAIEFGLVSTASRRLLGKT